MFRLRQAAIALAVFAASATGLLASGGGEVAEGSALIEPHLGTIIWTILTFIIFAFLLSKFAWKPLLGALDARETSIRESIESATKEREEAEKVLAESKQLVAEAHRERATAMSSAQEEAERLKAEILEEARLQREKTLEQTDAQVQASLRQAKAELRGVAVDLAIQAAGKLLHKNLDEPTQRQLVESYLADLEKSGESGSLPS